VVSMKKTIEFKLKASRSDQKFLLKLLDKGKNVYNLALSECRKRLNRIRADKEYQSLLPFRRDLKKAKCNTAVVDKLLEEIIAGRYFLTKTDIEKFVKDHIGYLSDKFNSQFAQVLADRAFEAIKKVLYGKAKKVRFKGKWDNILSSVHSKSTDTGFMFNHDAKAVTYGIGKKKITIPLILDYRKDDGYHNWYLQQIIDNFKNHEAVDVSYIRVIRRIIKGNDVFYVQFVIDIRPMGMTDERVEEENLRILQHNSELIHNAVSKGKPTNRLRLKHYVSNIIEFPKTSKVIEQIRYIGLYKQFHVAFDMGPRNMAVVLRNEDTVIAALQPVFNKIIEYQSDLRKLQRKLDRQRRANNPNNYNTDGTAKKRRGEWVFSEGYKQTRTAIREMHRLIAATRKTALNEFANILTALGCSFKTEDVSIRSWQKNYGRSVGYNAPSLVKNTIFAKAESAGDDTTLIPLKTALSQLCLCGKRQKKKLSQRVHECECGVKSQRDVLSAYLGLFYSPCASGVGGSLLLPLDHKADRQLLFASCWHYAKVANGQTSGFAVGLDRSPLSCSRIDEDRHLGENFDAQGLVCTDSLKGIIGELSLNRRSPVRLSSGIPRL